ncbi:MAG: alginate export family protein [Leptospiraceae bacterium]|nr:alginate export family protein [Leptospiraceae bacterium]MCP5510818.1 alginate export family protein [Leptospiraceae bacterium]
MKKSLLPVFIALCSLTSILGQDADVSKNSNESGENAVKTVIPPDYVSPMKGNLDPEFMRSLFLSPDQIQAVKKSNSLWFNNYRVGFYVRPRFDSKENFDFNKTTDDYSSYAAQTTQVWFVADPSPYFSLKVTIQDSRVWGGEQNSGVGDNRYALTTGVSRNYSATPVTSGNSTDIREAFIMLKKSDKLPVNIQIGRQVYSYGDLKVLGPLNWLYNGFAFDGVRIMYNSKYFSSHLFGTVLSEQHSAPGGLNTANGRTNGSIDDAYFTGTYNTIKPFDLFHIDIYGFGLHKKWILNTNPVTTQDRLRQRDDLLTGGFRITNRTAGNKLPAGNSWDWTVESAWQTGFNGERVNASWDVLNQEYAGQRIHTERKMYDARFFSAETGYEFFKKLRLGVGYTYASGDPNRSDSKVGTWSPLFPQIAGSLPYWNIMNGQSTIVGFQNVKTYSIRAKYRTDNFGSFLFTAYDTLKAKSQDSWYSVIGTTVANGSDENFSNNRYSTTNKWGKRLFYQYDLTWIYEYAEFLSIWSGVSYIQAQDSIKNVRNDPQSADLTKRYTFDPKAVYFYLMVSAAL